ncbi:MAG: hypothetical protein KU37_11025 [Sulfuricurvum sp. PC08-66]|nr:MAG: hypothetical protein KU37_11025 [Sulfuricurvum sp. PC08-66]
MTHHTACPLDCYDACHVVVEGDALKGGSDSFTQGALCEHLYTNIKHRPPLSSHIEGVSATAQECVGQLLSYLSTTPKERTLLYRGSGNLGVLQQSLEYFFAQHGGVTTHGSLCDGAGAAGIEAGRGKNYLVEPSQIALCDTVVVWGRNIDVTNSHMMRLIEGKKLIVIDPRKTKLAQKAHLHIQIKPRGDIYLALLLARFAHMEELVDIADVEHKSENYTWYYDFLRSMRIKRAIEKSDVLPSQIYTFLEMVAHQKVVYLVGRSVQAYSHGDSVLHAIDSLAMLLGHMGREGCGVNFLGDSMVDIDNPLGMRAKSVSKVTVDFSKYDLIVVQGANPLGMMPNSAAQEAAMAGKKVVYFGLDENETAQRANVVIAGVDFLSKKDVRISYGDNTLKTMLPLKESTQGISEYDLAQQLCAHFGYAPLPSQESIIDSLTAQSTHLHDNVYRINGRSEIPYAEGFFTEDEKFLFIEEMHDDFIQEGLWLISPKSRHSLNSQFRRSKALYLSPELGIAQGSRVHIQSEVGAIELEVLHDEQLRSDTAMIYSGTPKLNYLTSNRASAQGNSAIFQEISIKVTTL